LDWHTTLDEAHVAAATPLADNAASARARGANNTHFDDDNEDIDDTRIVVATVATVATVLLLIRTGVAMDYGCVR
jgi:hypothetical protein